MKQFVRNIERCDQCPNCGYIHYAGEGESSPYQYRDAFCSPTAKDLPNDWMLTTPESEWRKENYVPKRKIPDWCPLPDLKD